MKLTTKVGQIFLEHPKDENYASIYEETFIKQGHRVQLFAVMEVGDGFRGNQTKTKKGEYENLTRTIVNVFKKSYIQAVTIDEDAFERALAAINGSLGKLGAKSKINWFGKLNVALAAFSTDELCISTTGNALIYLFRGGNLSLLSEELGEEPKVAKIFSNYAAGKLKKGDRIILSTKQLFNYLSLARVREELREENLEDLCHEIITALADIKNIGFSTFIFETYPADAPGGKPEARANKISLLKAGPQPSNALTLTAVLRIAGSGAKTILKAAINILKLLATLALKLVGGKSSPAKRKSLVWAVAIILALLLISVGVSIWKKSTTAKRQLTNSNLVRAADLLNEAEAAAIYQDENRVLSLVAEAEKLLEEIKNQGFSEGTTALKAKIKSLKDKINKEVVIENPTVLASFASIPTDLLRSANGFLAFNKNTAVLAFYDFRSGEVKALFKNQNTSSLVAGNFVGGEQGFVFLGRSGKFFKVDITSEQLQEFPAESGVLPEPDQANIQGLAVLGEGNSARLYLLDIKRNQIWRFRVKETGAISEAEGWLKTEANFAEALDLAVDGNIFVLFRDRLEKYFNGSKQTFTLSAVSPGIKNASRIFAASDQQMIYILEPSGERILVYNKTGRLQSQLKSPKFRDAADFFVDERNKIIYVIAGQELLQVNF